MFTLTTSVPAAFSCSRRVRPSLSRKIWVVFFVTMRLPSARSWTDSVTASAEYGAFFVSRLSTPTRAT